MCVIQFHLVVKNFLFQIHQAIIPVLNYSYRERSGPGQKYNSVRMAEDAD